MRGNNTIQYFIFTPNQERVIRVLPCDKDVLYNAAIKDLNDRGVTEDDLVDLVIFLQSKYYPHLTREDFAKPVGKVLKKREVQNAIITGVQLDRLAEQGALQSPLQEIVANDEGLYGIDEIMAFSIVNVYGSIGFTNYGYIDKVKPGILQELNNKRSGHVHTFLDDIVGAIAAAASASLAHSCVSASVDDAADD